MAEHKTKKRKNLERRTHEVNDPDQGESKRLKAATLEAGVEQSNQEKKGRKRKR